MDSEKTKRDSSKILDIDSKSDLIQFNSENESDDPVSAYFKQRCESLTKIHFKMNRESGGDSSVGFIDIDNVPFFDDIENENFRLTSDSFKQRKSDISSDGKKSSKASLYNLENDLKKQRILAQKALIKFNKKVSINQFDLPLTPEKSRESSVLTDISSKLMNGKETIESEASKELFKPNVCSDTPRYFNDELSSFGGEESFSSKHDLLAADKKRNSEYIKTINLLLKKVPQVNINCDMEFPSQTEEEQVLRLKEDEKKFKLENSGLLHNSEISQFSGTIEGNESQWSCNADHQKIDSEAKKLSIGEFFNMRSNRISSLIGPEKNEINDFNLVEKSGSKTLDNSKMKNSQKNDNSLPISEKCIEKSTLRRCVSTVDLEHFSDHPKQARHSNDSSSSNSTIMIQNLIAEMESGLSGTQIYEKLINYGRNKSAEKKRKEKGIYENNETPKSSKLPRRKELGNKMMNNVGEKRTNLNFNKGTEMTDSKRESDFTVSRDIERKENKPVHDLEENQSFLSKKNENVKQVKNRKGFDASTPKFQHLKSHNNKFKTACNKILMESQDWEPPRISTIQSMIDLDKTEHSEENDKTITTSSGCSSERDNKNNNLLLNDTLTIEDTILAGDLTIISKRIEEMKEDSVCIVRSSEPEEPVILTIVQKLANFPKGSIDCSALTPLLRDQFPELLSTFPTPLTNISPKSSFASLNPLNFHEEFVSLPSDCWIKLPEKMGYSKKIVICVGVERCIGVPLTNVTKNWLLASIESVEITRPTSVKLSVEKNQKEWILSNFFSVLMRDTLIPPNSYQSLQVCLTPETSGKIDFMVSFSLKNLLSQEIQSTNLIMRIHVVNPSRSINIIPNDFINFGTIADQCSDSNIVQVSFNGICRVPFMVSLIENDFQSGVFILKPCVSKTVNSCKGQWNDNEIYYEFEEEEKQILEFRVCFQPNAFLNLENQIQDFKAILAFKIITKKEVNIFFKKVPVKGSVGLAKFLCSSSCAPLVFIASDKKESVTRRFPVKNVGLLPIAFTIKIMDEETQTEQDDNVFVAPKTFYLSRNEESQMNITFNANKVDNCIKRKMVLQIKPNGRTEYEVELIGKITLSESRSLSRASSETAKSVVESLPVKLMTTHQTLTWTSIRLEKEVRQSLQLKNASNVSVIARLTFQKNLDSFKFVNENGESVHKLRKILKPGCPYTLTVSFRPNETGPHHNVIFVELDHIKGKKMIHLSGIGGTPLLFMGNVKSDLNGCKMLKLQNSCPGNQIYSNTLEFKNDGRIPGFILIRPSMDVFALSYELIVTPSCTVVAPDSIVSVKVSQRLKSDDLKLLLSGKDISKLATLSIIMGDEPSRLRLRKMLDKGIIEPSKRLKILTDLFYQEKKMDLTLFQDSFAFEQNFLKSLKIIQVAVVVEKSSEPGEATLLEDADETLNNFVTIISATNKTIASPNDLSSEYDSKSQRSNEKFKDEEVSVFSSDKLASQKITKWLETLDSTTLLD